MERLVMASAPWQAWAMRVRSVYRWERPMVTGKWLLIYLVLWYTEHTMGFLVSGSLENGVPITNIFNSMGTSYTLFYKTGIGQQALSLSEIHCNALSKTRVQLTNSASSLTNTVDTIGVNQSRMTLVRIFKYSWVMWRTCLKSCLISTIGKVLARRSQLFFSFRLVSQ